MNPLGGPPIAGSFIQDGTLFAWQTASPAICRATRSFLTSLANDLLVAMPPPAPLIAPAQGLFAFPGYRTLGFYDASCHERDRWNVEESWGIQDASADRELLSVSELSG